MDQLQSQESALNWFGYFDNVDYDTETTDGCFDDSYMSEMMDGD